MRRRHHGPAPFLFFGLAAFVALSVVANHPFLALFGLLWVGSRIARRVRRELEADSWDVPVEVAERRSRSARAARRERTSRSRPSEVPASATRAWRSARAAVEGSTALTDEDKADMRETLDQGLKAVREITAALQRIRGDEDARLDSVADAAARRARKFEADCETLRRSVAALEIQEGDASALDALAEAAETLVGRVDARREIDRL